MTALVIGTYQLAWRAVRETIRQPGVEVGNLFIPLFFFFVTVGAISNIAAPALGIENYEAFQLPSPSRRASRARPPSPGSRS